MRRRTIAALIRLSRADLRGSHLVLTCTRVIMWRAAPPNVSMTNEISRFSVQTINVYGPTWGSSREQLYLQIYSELQGVNAGWNNHRTVKLHNCCRLFVGNIFCINWLFWSRHLIRDVCQTFRKCTRSTARGYAAWLLSTELLITTVMFSYLWNTFQRKVLNVVTRKSVP